MTNKRLWVGGLTALFSAVTFALNMVCASISYDHGANIHALNFARAEGFFFCLLVVVLIRRLDVVIPKKTIGVCCIVGILLFGLMYMLLGAVQTIPVALAVLIFYTYPILVAIHSWVVGATQFSITSLVLMLVAFGALLVVLIDSPIELELMGIAFSILAAVIMSTMLVTNEKFLKQYNNTVVLFHVLGVVLSLTLLLSVTVVDHHWPHTVFGWSALGGSTFFYVMATFSLFKSVNLIGPLRTAIIDNTAPVWAMIFGFLLLSQLFSLQQLIGAVVVIAAVIFLQLSTHAKE